MIPRGERKNNTDEKPAPTKIVFISFISSSEPPTPGPAKTFHYRMTHSATTIYAHHNVHSSRTNGSAFHQRELSTTRNARKIPKRKPLFIFLKKIMSSEPAPLQCETKPEDQKPRGTINVMQ